MAVYSPTFGTNNQYIKYRIVVEEGAYNVSANTSPVTVTVQAWRTNSGYKTDANGSCACGINGVAYSNSWRYNDGHALTQNSYTTLFNTTVTISHENDGSKAIWVSASFSYPNSGVSSSDQGFTVQLATIPRATNAPSISGYVGQTTGISLARYSSSFTHNLRYSFGSLSGTIATGVATSYNWTMPTSFYAQIGNAKSKTGTLYVDTYNGGSLVGTKSATFTAMVNESLAKLRVSISSVVDTDNSAIALTGSSSKFIASISDAKVVFTITSPSSATVSSLRVNNVGITASLRQYTISNINTKSITVSATDSRGYVTTATYTIPNANWIAYVPVSVKGSVVRTDGVSGNVHLNFNGNYWTGNFGSVSNTLNVQYRYQQEGGEWSSWLPENGASYTISGTTYQQQNAITISNININNSYNFQIRAKDAVNTSGAVYSVLVDRAKPVAWWNNTYFTVNNILRYTTMSQTSLENLKKNFRELGDVMDVVKHFKIYSYNFVDEKDSERRHYGFVIPTNENSPFETPEQVIAKGDEGIDVYAMCSILWRAVQQQQEEIEDLKKKIV